jgi:hypothetical protein
LINELWTECLPVVLALELLLEKRWFGAFAAINEAPVAWEFDRGESVLDLRFKSVQVGHRRAAFKQSNANVQPQGSQQLRAERASITGLSVATFG